MFIGLILNISSKIFFYNMDIKNKYLRFMFNIGKKNNNIITILLIILIFYSLIMSLLVIITLINNYPKL